MAHHALVHRSKYCLQCHPSVGSCTWSPGSGRASPARRTWRAATAASGCSLLKCRWHGHPSSVSSIRLRAQRGGHRRGRADNERPVGAYHQRTLGKNDAGRNLCTGTVRPGWVVRIPGISGPVWRGRGKCVFPRRRATLFLFLLGSEPRYEYHWPA